MESSPASLHGLSQTPSLIAKSNEGTFEGFLLNSSTELQLVR